MYSSRTRNPNFGVCWQVSSESMYIIERSRTRDFFVHVSSETDQDRVIDALSPLEPSIGGEDGVLSAAQLLALNHTAVVAVVTPTTVAQALRTISFR